MGTAWKQAQKICYTLKTLCYARQQAAILGQDWTLTVSSNDVKMPKEKKNWEAAGKASKEYAQLKKLQDQLKSKVLKLSNDVKKCKEAGYNPTHRQTIPKATISVLQRASMELEAEAKAKLCWITGVVAVKGCSASKVEIVNRKTGGTELVKLINCDPDDFLGPGESEVSSNKCIWGFTVPSPPNST